jgi:hypothetical protein
MNTHSHKVRARNGLMLVNYEAHPFGATPRDFVGGVKVFDIANPAKPRELSFFRAAGSGAHRFDFDGRYAYLSPEMPGYVGNIVVIVDLIDPSHPREVARWWLPGQWIDGGERPTWEGKAHRVHHALRFGNRLYVSCWQAGLCIVDVTDITKPRTITSVRSVYGYPTHTVQPIPDGGAHRDLCAVVDEGWNDAGEALPACLWVVDISDPAAPRAISKYNVDEVPSADTGFWGAHQPHERIVDGFAFVAWFQHGLRAVDLADPLQPRSAGAFIPPPRPGRSHCLSNDVYVDDRGRAYLADRGGGLDILEWSAH